MHINNHLANVNLHENDYGEHVLQEEGGEKTAKKLFGRFSGKTKVEKETWWWNGILTGKYSKEEVSKEKVIQQREMKAVDRGTGSMRAGKGKRLIVRSDTWLAEQRDCGATQAHLYSRLVLLKTE